MSKQCFLAGTAGSSPCWVIPRRASRVSWFLRPEESEARHRGEMAPAPAAPSRAWGASGQPRHGKYQPFMGKYPFKNEEKYLNFWHFRTLPSRAWIQTALASVARAASGRQRDSMPNRWESASTSVQWINWFLPPRCGPTTLQTAHPCSRGHSLPRPGGASLLQWPLTGERERTWNVHIKLVLQENLCSNIRGWLPVANP